MEFLAAMPSAGPLIGLLGMVYGMTKTFAAIGREGSSVDVVRWGVADALVATAAGLGCLAVCAGFRYLIDKGH